MATWSGLHNKITDEIKKKNFFAHDLKAGRLGAFFTHSGNIFQRGTIMPNHKDA